MTDEPNRINDGGPAFPKPCDECSHAMGEHACYGMSLRAWLVGQYTAAIVSSNYVAWGDRQAMVGQALALADDTIAALETAPKTAEPPE